MATSRVQRAHHGRSGATTVELAVVLPVFLMFLFGIFELSRVGMIVHMLNTASRAAARYGATEGITTAQAEQRAIQTVSPVLSANHVDIAVKDARVFDRGGPYPTDPCAIQALPDVELAQVAPRDPFLIQMSVPYDEIAIVPFPLLDGLVLYGQSVMRHE